MKRQQIIQTLILALALGSLAVAARAQTRESPAQTASRAEALNNQGVDLLEAGKFAEAAALLQAAVRARPAYVIAYSNLGAALYRAGQLDKAIAALQKAIELKSDYAEDYSK